jgi:hypothetical protein
MRRLALLLIALPLLGAVPLPPDAIRPGYWETTSKVLSPITQTKTEKRCITARDVERFMLGSPNHIYTCTYPIQVVANGRMLFRGDCISRGGRKAKFTGEGDYSPTSLHVTGEVKSTLGPLPFTAKVSTDARRLGDVCPPAAAGNSPKPR